MTLKAFKECFDRLYQNLLETDGEYNTNNKLVKFFKEDKEMDMISMGVFSKYSVDTCNGIVVEPTCIRIDFK